MVAIQAASTWKGKNTGQAELHQKEKQIELTWKQEAD